MFRDLNLEDTTALETERHAIDAGSLLSCQVEPAGRSIKATSRVGLPRNGDHLPRRHPFLDREDAVRRAATASSQSCRHHPQNHGSSTRARGTRSAPRFRICLMGFRICLMGTCTSTMGCRTRSAVASPLTLVRARGRLAKTARVPTLAVGCGIAVEKFRWPPTQQAAIDRRCPGVLRRQPGRRPRRRRFMHC